MKEEGNITDKTTILFDLDGTLLPLDMDDFIKKYFKLLTEEFSDLGAAPEFIEILMASTRDMIENDGGKTNKDIFELSFFNRLSVENKKEILRRFDDFYRHKFPLLERKFEFDYSAADLIELLKEKNYKLVLATNAIFPREAIIERVKWAQVNPDVFSFISSYENMHFAKPNINFYKEILEKIEEDPEDCIMIGNDVEEDMIAGKLGMTTFLVEDYKIERTNSCQPDWRGSFSELIKIFS